MQKLIKLLKWLVTIAEKVVNFWPVFGAVAVTFAASITNWLSKYGPIAWASAGIASYLLLVCGYWIYAKARGSLAATKFSEGRDKLSTINPLQGVFANQRIRLSDFYNTFFQATKNAKFTDCELLGPAAIYLFGSTKLEHAFFSNCEAVLLKNNTTVVGATVFDSCIFERCKFFGVTFFMSREMLIHFRESGIPLRVISDGTAGDL
jgi:hypothetical protein